WTVVTMAGTVIVTFVLVGAMVGAISALVSLVRLATGSRRRRERRRRMRHGPGWAAGSAQLPEPRPAPEDWRAEWRAARKRFDDLRAEYGRYECDPLAVLRLPALADVTVPSTGRFVDAFAEAQALHGEHEDREPPQEYAASYVGAVERAWQAWRAASDAAERIRLAGLSPEERASVQRVIKLLTVAKDSGHDAERAAAYAKARAELAKLERAGRIHLPRPAMAALDASSRAGLPSGFATGTGQDASAAQAM
ncbi:MAG: hypothetical protein J2P20_15740, partial [Pseudonocardia sp.]|nr:hypothetical protein [Pseudonocardia sp.]